MHAHGDERTTSGAILRNTTYLLGDSFSLAKEARLADEPQGSSVFVFLVLGCQNIWHNTPLHVCKVYTNDIIFNISYN